MKQFQSIWNVLFDRLSLEADEYVEVAYDDGGNKQFNRAFHVKSLEELEEKVQELTGKCNITITPSIRKVEDSQKNKRTGSEYVSKQKAIILDIDNPNNHERLEEEEARELCFKVFNKLPERVKQAVALMGYTGGGVQIYISFEPLVGKDNIKKAYELLKETLKPIKDIDPASFTVGQLQRLLGTLNLKHGVEAKVLTTFNEPKPLTIETLRELKKEKNNTLEEAIKLIKERVRVETLNLLKLKEMNGYLMAFCPFHPEENPSFAIYHNADGDLCKDFHDGENYDVIALYQKLQNKTFNEAIQDLAKIGGVDLTGANLTGANLTGVNLTGAKVKGGGVVKAVENLKKDENPFDPEGYVDELPIKKIETFIEDGVITFEITVENIYGLTYTFKATISELANWKRFKHLFLQYTGIDVPELPKKGRDEALKQVVKVIMERAEKSKYFVRKSDDDILDAILEELARGGLFGTFEEFLEPASQLNGFVDSDNNYYTTLAILKKITKKLGIGIPQNKLKEIILKAGGEYIRYNETRDKRKWVYRLPSSFNGGVIEKRELKVWGGGEA